MRAAIKRRHCWQATFMIGHANSRYRASSRIRWYSWDRPTSARRMARRSTSGPCKSSLAAERRACAAAAAQRPHVIRPDMNHEVDEPVQVADYDARWVSWYEADAAGNGTAEMEPDGASLCGELN
jgi:hypothetical protein